MSYERLIDEHAQIDIARVRLQCLMDTDTPDVGAVVVALSDLARQLADHLAHEDSFIYPRMIAGSNTESSSTANNFVSEFADLRRDWLLYVAEWNGERIAADWARFRSESERMNLWLEQRVRAENELLYAMALKTNAIPLRERRAG